MRVVVGRTWRFRRVITNQAQYARVASNVFTSLEDFTVQERRALQNDPFLTTRDLSLVTFRTFDPAQAVAKYYQAEFRKHGWTKVRGGLLPEFSYGGGDWIAVYQNGSQLVRVHVMGPWKRDSEERIGIGKGEYVVRSIMLTFHGLKASQLLGGDYNARTGCYDDPVCR